jgi:pimeloyl-ACP methyl ester carboxylesterase
MQKELDAIGPHERQLRALLRDAALVAPEDYAQLRIVPLPATQSAMAYFELGDPNGTPLVCLHGLSVSGLFFAQYHEHFVANGIRGIAPCLLGGIHISDASRSIDDLTTALIELLDILEVGKFDVIGFSWGTLPELALVARVPDRVRRAGFMGPMLPVEFLATDEVARLKSDVRMSIDMTRRAPWLHRGLMWLVCRLPTQVLVHQFKDPKLSEAEAEALESGTVFHASLSRCIDECRRTGSQFFTCGWRMFSDKPGYSLSDLAKAAARVDLRLYVGEQDNVHLPSFAYRIAAACSGRDEHPLARDVARQAAHRGDTSQDVFQNIHSQPHCSIWMAAGAGRMACMLYFKQALDQLLSAPEGHPVAARGALAQ